ncbi:hypothetical protein ACK1KB_02590 [Chryseobacterium sp. TY3]
MPKEVGDYFIVIFTNNSYNEVSKCVQFEMYDSTLATAASDAHNNELQVYPNPAKQGEKNRLKIKISD